MKAEILDKDREIYMALRVAGFDIDNVATEIILNVIDFVRNAKHDITIKEITQLKHMVKDLYKS